MYRAVFVFVFFSFACVLSLLRFGALFPVVFKMSNCAVSCFAASAIDSRFEFKVDDPPRYTLLLGRAFPKLSEFTVAFWINVSNPAHPGTVLSYRHADSPNVMRFLSGPKLTFDIWGQRQVTQTVLIPHELVHIAWSWSSKGECFIYFFFIKFIAFTSDH